MKVLVLSSLYPNPAQKRHGIFIEHRISHLLAPDDEAVVVAPVPWFPSRNARFGKYASFASVPSAEERRGFRIEHPRYPVVPKVGQTLSPLLMARWLAGAIDEVRARFDFDVIDSYYLYPDGVAAGWLARRAGRPFVMSALGSDVSLIPNWRPSRSMILRAISKSSATTGVCRALLDRLETLGADPSKLHLVEHGVDRDLFRPLPDRIATRRAEGFDGPTILSVGHLIDRKGHDLAIGAVARLPGVTLLIAGDGPRAGALRAIADRLGVSNRVRFLGHVDQPRLATLYGAADITVLCSDREGIANVLLESLACGTPLVATAVWGSPDVVRVPEAGVLVDRTVDSIAAGAARLIAAPPDRDATRRYSERFSWREAGNRHRALLETAVDRFRRPAA